MEPNDELRDKTDEEIVSLVLSNQDNFSYIIKRYQDKLLRYIRRISSYNNADAEDVLQDVFIKVYKNINDFDTSMKFSSWIYRITHNQVISEYRKRKARPEQVPLNLEDQAIKRLKSDLAVDDKTDQVFLRKIISEALSHMDEKYREVLVLKFFEEKSYQEISDIIKKPLGTVATLINRAKQNLKVELEHHGL